MCGGLLRVNPAVVVGVLGANRMDSPLQNQTSPWVTRVIVAVPFTAPLLTVMVSAPPAAAGLSSARHT